jgi:hypothetical protein
MTMAPTKGPPPPEYPYTEKQLSKWEAEAFRHVRNGVNMAAVLVANKSFVGCHELAEAVHRSFGYERVSGEFLRGYEHSWNIMSGDRHRQFIIDVYPVAVVSGGPLLWDASQGMYPAPQMFRADPEFVTQKINEKSVEMLTDFLNISAAKQRQWLAEVEREDGIAS